MVDKSSLMNASALISDKTHEFLELVKPILNGIFQYLIFTIFLGNIFDLLYKYLFCTFFMLMSYNLIYIVGHILDNFFIVLSG